MLPAIARGKHLSTLAFSESGSGGHFCAPVSPATRNGHADLFSASKSFVTSAGEADSYVVSARTAGATGRTESDLYLISKGAIGFTTLGRFEGLGLAGNARAPMKLDRVIFDADRRLGPGGSGFQTIMEAVLPHFQIGAASVSLGIATAAFWAIASRVSATRYEHAGGTALSEILRVQFLAAEMAIELNSAHAYLQETIRKALACDPNVIVDVLGVNAKTAESCASGFFGCDDTVRGLGFRAPRRP